MEFFDYLARYHQKSYAIWISQKNTMDHYSALLQNIWHREENFNPHMFQNA